MQRAAALPCRDAPTNATLTAMPGGQAALVDDRSLSFYNISPLFSTCPTASPSRLFAVHSSTRAPPVCCFAPEARDLWWFRQRISMARHHPDLIMCRKQPGIAIGRLCEKCKSLPPLSNLLWCCQRRSDAASRPRRLSLVPPAAHRRCPPPCCCSCCCCSCCCCCCSCCCCCCCRRRQVRDLR